MEMEDSKKKKEKMCTKEEVVVEMGGLNEDVMLEVFDRIPIKQLTQMKCLSKGWCSLISHYRRSKPRSNISTLVCQYKVRYSAKNSQVIFYDVKEQVGQEGEIVLETLENHSLSFSIDNETFQLLGSSNGLVLYKIYNFEDHTFIPYVSNPILNQWVSLPPICEDERFICIGLAVDAGEPQHHFKVVWYPTNTVNKYSKHVCCEIYCSDTGTWREKRARLFNSFVALPLLVPEYDPPISFFYRKGMMHWVVTNIMVVYHFEDNFFKTISLPLYLGRLWESEGYLHYVGQYQTGFAIFKYLEDVIFDTEDNEETHSRKWQSKHYIEFCTFGYVQFCDFNEDLQELLLIREGTIISYSLETKKWKKVLACKLISKNKSTSDIVLGVFAFSFMQLSGINLPSGGQCKLMKPNSESGVILEGLDS
ncbi:hypothetical protein FRX31_014165 [Thalictrum thalictroides]|uniref:F-box protein n=1 Tax=Thalictrum thalictroides TaxID=46969 RepID=A0A7J6WH09_THATH|nr:hypothetical protein FRX31_014165 [Thalictrum thalictroides]